MERYTIDTVAFLAYLIDVLPPKSNAIFQKAENEEIILILPSIVIGETIYTILKQKEVFGKLIPVEKISEIFEIIQGSESILLVDMNIESWKMLLTINISELHDRMIIATHLVYNSKAIITDDHQIVSITNTIW